MGDSKSTLTLTVAQAIIKYLANQFIKIDGDDVRICGGGFGIFGHGNVTCLGEALYENQAALPLYRGQNEQSMGFAAAAYAKYHLRRRFMFCTASAGPGTANLLTASALAHANRLPMLMLCGDSFVTRLPDPVLQQLENFHDPTLGLTDAFRPVTRFWDRITHPAQIIQSLPAALATMLDPADCGPVFIGLPQDVQGWIYDYPRSFFEKKRHRIRRNSPDMADLKEAADLLAKAKRPMIIAGGGIQYSKATKELEAFADATQIPVVETIAGRANLRDDHPLNIGPIGVTGSNSANKIAEKADVILCAGTRLQDFTTGSWTAFSKDARLVSINVGRHDATKHLSHAVIGDAKIALASLGSELKAYKAPQNWTEEAKAERKEWKRYVAENISYSDNKANAYAQAIGVVNKLCDPADRIVAAAGGLPAEISANWETRKQGTVDIEFGFSCMGYEIAGGWGARIAQSEKEASNDTIVFVGDGSYLLMNSDIYSAVLTQKKLIILILDNAGFAVINKLQNNTGNESFNNLFADTPTATCLVDVDFESHARALGATAEKVANPTEMQAAFKRAKASDTTYVIYMKVDAYDGWTQEGHTWWEVGTPHMSANPKVQEAHINWEATRKRQRRGV